MFNVFIHFLFQSGVHVCVLETVPSSGWEDRVMLVLVQFSEQETSIFHAMPEPPV